MRREHLCLEFAMSCTKNKNTSDMFPLNKLPRNREKFILQNAKKERLRKSAIPYMQGLLNKNSAN